MRPCLSMASLAYDEHVGWNLQQDINRGETNALYSPSNASASHCPALSRRDRRDSQRRCESVSGEPSKGSWQRSNNTVLHILRTGPDKSQPGVQHHVESGGHQIPVPPYRLPEEALAAIACHCVPNPSCDRKPYATGQVRSR